ncbi:hypothetical protein ZIOFF_044255 [Zingiber officinale]|uniref:Protein EXECUTER 2, chloroplastic n=1 Tax=Zingiber officinale TaxID=94328 RepID=A0A8J5G1V3_ZINOF|nr:hypothetical protein ZIOFF_044255 [Zingiber officinale]
MKEAMSAANPWAATAVAPPSRPLRLGRLDQTLREARHLSLAAPSPRRPALKSDRCPPALSCLRGDSVPTNIGSGGIQHDWDWNRWSQHFSEIDQAESFSSLLKFQLEEAIEREDFLEAAKLKMAIEEATANDTVAQVISELKYAIAEERYHDASRLCILAGSGMIGWWFGCSKDSDDPFGRIVRITPAVGRYVAKSYNPRQLVSGSTGTPLFEVFLVKDEAGKYTTQVVALQPVKETSTLSHSSTSRSGEGSSTSVSSKSSNSDNTSPTTEAPDKSSQYVEEENKGDGAKLSNEQNNKDPDEGLKSIISFFKERIPGLNIKLRNTSAPQEMKMDVESPDQLLQEDNEKDASSDDSSKLEDNKGVSDGEDPEFAERSKNMAVKLFVGGVVHNKEDSVTKLYRRVPAKMEYVVKDSFTLYLPGQSAGSNIVERKPAKIRVAAMAAQSASDLMPPDVANAFFSSDKAISKVSEEVREVMKLAISQAQRRNRLSETTVFSRIVTDNKSFDPFDGLYVGAFGPYGVEVVQLQHKYGNWNDTDESGSEMDFFEYVEAVKLTGDLNVPAGEACCLYVTFRAKIGKGNRLTNRGMFPEELGVAASYKGEGRIAEAGFKNPQWVSGELLLFNGKGLGPYVKGTELGFLYVVPEQSFLVLFERLKLPD